MKFSRLHGKLRLQMHDLQVGAHNLKITNPCKINSVVDYVHVSSWFKTLKQLLHALSRVSSSFIDFDTYFKALIRFLKLLLGKVLCRQ